MIKKKEKIPPPFVIPWILTAWKVLLIVDGLIFVIVLVCIFFRFIHTIFRFYLALHYFYFIYI